MTYGHYQRPKTRLVVRKNWDPLEAKRAIRSLPVKSGEVIASGQVLAAELEDGQWKWALADRSNPDHLLQIPHFALGDSTDKDVVSAGKLNAVSAASNTELQTAFFSENGTEPINGGTPLTFGSGADIGNVITTERGAGPSFPIIGYLTFDHVAGPINLEGFDSSAVDKNVVRFETQYDPQNAAS